MQIYLDTIIPATFPPDDFLTAGWTMPKARPRSGGYHCPKYKDWQSRAISWLLNYKDRLTPAIREQLPLELVGFYALFHGSCRANCDNDNLIGSWMDAYKEAGFIQNDHVKIVPSIYSEYVPAPTSKKGKKEFIPYTRILLIKTASIISPFNYADIPEDHQKLPSTASKQN